MRKNCARRSRQKRRGFTLLEILLVLAILVVIGGSVAINYMNVGTEANRDFAKTQMNGFKDAIRLYQLNVGTLPSSLDALVEKPGDLADPSKWKGPYLESAVPLDPWGAEYEFKLSGTAYEISSRGPDGQAGTEDDVTVKKE